MNRTSIISIYIRLILHIIGVTLVSAIIMLGMFIVRMGFNFITN